MDVFLRNIGMRVVWFFHEKSEKRAFYGLFWPIILEGLCRIDVFLTKYGQTRLHQLVILSWLLFLWSNVFGHFGEKGTYVWSLEANVWIFCTQNLNFKNAIFIFLYPKNWRYPVIISSTIILIQIWVVFSVII